MLLTSRIRQFVLSALDLVLEAFRITSRRRNFGLHLLAGNSVLVRHVEDQMRARWEWTGNIGLNTGSDETNG